jgi:hypothetical protein
MYDATHLTGGRRPPSDQDGQQKQRPEDLHGYKPERPPQQAIPRQGFGVSPRHEIFLFWARVYNWGFEPEVEGFDGTVLGNSVSKSADK